MKEKEAFMKSGLIEEYVLGLSNATDMSRVESMAEKYEEVAALLKETRQAMEQYCRASRRETSPEIRERLFKALRSESHRRKGVIRQFSAKSHKSNWKWASPLAMTITILTLSIAGIFLHKNNELKKDLLASKSANDDMMSRMNGMMSKHKTTQSQFFFLQDLNTSHIQLKDVSDNSKPMAVIYWNKSKQEAFMHIVNLPHPTVGMTYQLWAGVRGEMKDMGVIMTDSNWISLPFIRHAENLNITIEKRGGSIKPTLEKLVCTASI